MSPATLCRLMAGCVPCKVAGRAIYFRWQRVHRTPPGDWHSVAVYSDGSYGVEEGLISSFPIRTVGPEWEIVQNISLNEFSRQKIDASVNELKEEKELVAELLGV